MNKRKEQALILLEAAQGVTIDTEAWLGKADTDNLYVLIVSLILAFIAFVILMRRRF
ncbi:MAG TPA: hypothetical protein VNY06_02635 [Methylocella sp.]|nr:hypothetical protein [Methylocella sp.]